MTVTEPRFTVRTPGVVHDTIDTETLVINLETGSYYTLEGAGAAAWTALVDGATRAQVTAAVAGSLGLEQSAVAGQVTRLLGELLDRGLIRSPEGEPAGLIPAEEGDADGPPGLELRCYDELQELLLIDPIHEVDEAGWPSRAPASP